MLGKNVDGESGKTRKKSGKSRGILWQKFGRHPVSASGKLVISQRVSIYFLKVFQMSSISCRIYKKYMYNLLDFVIF